WSGVVTEKADGWFFAFGASAGTLPCECPKPRHMLSSRLEDPARLADRLYIAEPKLDGQRAQGHVRDGRIMNVTIPIASVALRAYRVDMAKPLELELAFYLEKKPELLRTHPGQFVLIKGREIVGIYPSQNDAYVVGFSRFIREPFLVKHIVENEPT